MSNLHTHFDALTDEEFLAIRSNILDAVDAVGTARDIDVKRKANGRVTADIAGIVVESLEKIESLLKILGPNAEWMNDDQMEDAKRIAA